MQHTPLTDAERNRLFMQLFTQHARRIFSYVLTLVGNHNEAEEVFQETSMTLWEKFSEFEPGTHFGAWACRIAFFKAKLFHGKKQASAVLSSEALDLIDGELVASSDALDAQYQALADCYAKLPKHDRDLIDRRYQGGAKAAEIAECLGRSRISVYRALARIHEQLLQCITHSLDQNGLPHEGGELT